MLGVSRNLLYYRISRAVGEIRIEGRLFRTRLSRSDGSLLFWPYMKADDPLYDGIIKDVNNAVPRTIADAARADICQEMVIAVLTGEVEQCEIKSAVQRHIRQHYKMFPIKDHRTRSLDSVIRGTDQLLIDTISADDVAERISDAWEANRLLTRTSNRRITVAVKPESANPEPYQYAHWRRKYGLVKGKVVRRDVQPEGFGGSWSIETALSEEIEKIT